MTTEKTNIEQFNEFTALALAYLYEHFPMTVHLTAKEIVKDMEDVNEFGGLDGRGQLAVETILRLHDYGLITGARAQHGLYDACLTIQGLQILNSVPQTIKTKASLGSNLLDVVKGSSSITLGALGADALAVGASLISRFVQNQEVS